MTTTELKEEIFSNTYKTLHRLGRGNICNLSYDNFFTVGKDGIVNLLSKNTKEMNILMTNFVKSLINDLDENFLKSLDSFGNLDDETLISIEKKELLINYKDEKILHIIKKFQKFK